MKTRTARLHLLPVTLVAALLVAAAAMVIQSPTASAHAEYVSSTPASNSTVTQAPTVVTVHFGEDVNPNGSALTVYDSHGKVVSTGPGSVETSDAKTMTVPMTGDDSESYVVVWHSVSLDDGDPAIGAFLFNVGSPAKTGNNGGSTTSPGTIAASPGGASSSSGAPGWLVALVGIIGLIVGAGGALALTGKRR